MVDMVETFQVIVVGGGHAGIEAAYISAKMGVRTALISLSKDSIGLMPCNPSIGGLGKGHIVYEVSALGGLMPQLCNDTYVQARMLNTSKGPAVQGLRLQIDKYAYKKAAQQALSCTPNLTIIEGMVQGLELEATADGMRIAGVRVTVAGAEKIYYAGSVVITAGTFLNGVLHVGLQQTGGGRVGEAAVTGLSGVLHEVLGVQLGRLKTGTPPRLRGTSVNYAVLEKQEPQPLDVLFTYDAPAGGVRDRMACYLAHTTAQTHEIIAKNIHLSAMYSGNIKGVGPRYCPSIEDKIGRYPDRLSHHVFVEPEGMDIDEIYPAGLSTSLPYDVQVAYIQSIPGFEQAEIVRPGYAVEYDFVQPTILQHTLETKKVAGLFFAGQINGTTGYEEAAGQGILAGINAALKAQGKEPFILDRSESYIGVMVDDLVTLGVDEPYRMFTSRAERRLLLRQDNVFARLMPYGYALGTIDHALYARFQQEQEMVKRVTQHLLARKQSPAYWAFQQLVFEQAEQEKAISALHGLFPDHVYTSRMLLQIYAAVRYDGYLQREEAEAARLRDYAHMRIHDDLVYRDIPGLSFELQQKLTKYKPATIAQAQLIPGMTPAAVSLIMYHMRKGLSGNK